MFEFIGVLVVIWIGYSVLRGIFRAAKGTSTSSSREFGMEARRICTVELGAPNSYYNYMVTNKIDAIKNAALGLRDNDEEFKRCSWPRLLALVIYAEYHQDCEQWRFGNPLKEQLFQLINISPQEISKELDRDVKSVIYNSR